MASNADFLTLRNDSTPPTITITVMVRDLYFINDPGTFNNYKAGTIGGIFFAGQDAIVVPTS